MATNPLEDLLRAGDFDEALRRIDAGELDPASAPSGVYFAAKAESPELLRRLLAAGADPNHPSSPGPLQIAAGAGRLASVEALLAAGADPNAGGTFGSPLADAIGGGHDEIAARLVVAGARDAGRGGSQLVRAAFHGLPRAVRAMLAAGYDLDGRASIDPWRQRATDKALERAGNALSGLMSLMTEVDDVDEADDDAFTRLASIQDRIQELRDESGGSEADGEGTGPSYAYDNAPAVVVAAGEGHRNVLELLVTAGADPSAADDGGVTPRAAAERAGHVELADWLAAVGGAREARLSADEELLAAAETGDAARVHQALAAGADADARDRRQRTRDRTPLLLAVEGGHADVVLVLLDAGASVELRDRPEGERARGLFGEPATAGNLDTPGVRFGLTPLALAAVLDRASCAQVLAAAGADVEACDDLGYSCLQLAAANGSAATLEALLAAGADPSRSGPGGPAIFVAAGDGHASCVAALLAAGADPCARHDGDALLHMAATLGDAAMLGALLDAGADATARNQDGKTALHVAREYARLGIVSYDAAVLARLAAATGAAGDEIVEPEEEDYPEVELPALAAELEARYEGEAVRARLAGEARSDAFRAVVAELAELCGSEPQPVLDGAGVALHVHSVRARGELAAEKLDVEALQRQWMPRGVFLLGGRKRELIVLPTTDPLEAIAAYEACGPNYDVLPTHVLEFFRTHPAIVTRIAHDTVAGRFETLPEDPAALADEIYALCPDTVEQGVGEIEVLAEMLGESGVFYLWWD